MQPIIHFYKNQFDKIYSKCHEIQSLNVLLHRYLPAEFHNQCQIGSFNNGCLTLIASDATWATQLRYLVPEIRDKLRTEGQLFQLSSIKIKLIDENQQEPTPNKRHPTLSRKAHQHILAGSNDCSDENIKAALKKLAENFHKHE